MKSRYGRSTVIVATLAIAGLCTMIYTQSSRRAAASYSQQPGLPLVVTFNPTNRDANTQQLYQTMQNLINGFAMTPADRMTYYSAMNNVNGYVIDSWCGFITNVQQNANGYLVSIDVLPEISGAAACAIVTGVDYSEQYQVFADGSFQYVGSLDPQGLAGQMPGVIGL